MNEITNTIPIQVYLRDNVPVVTSRNVAEYFHKRHDHVLRDIDKLISEINEATGQNPILEADTVDYGSKLSSITLDFPPILGATHFKEISYIASNGKSNREFEITKDGFTLLAMGFTGKEALKWKLKYVEAFNRMEQILSNGTAVPPYPSSKEIPAAPPNIHVQTIQQTTPNDPYINQIVAAVKSLYSKGYRFCYDQWGIVPQAPCLGFYDIKYIEINVKPLMQAMDELFPNHINRAALYQYLHSLGLIETYLDMPKPPKTLESKNNRKLIQRTKDKHTYRVLRFYRDKFPYLEEMLK